MGKGSTLLKMIRCPPEVILRPLAGGRLVPVDVKSTEASGGISQKSRRLLMQNAGSDKRTYKAAICTELGKPMIISKLTAQEVLNHQVRIKVCSAAVNFGDLLTVQGTYQEKLQPPFTPGTEFAGVVTETGPDATSIKVGTRVCGMCYGSAFAEEVVVNETDVCEIPDKMSFTVASGFLSSYATAVLALEAKAKIKKGEKLLITAAAGAVGLAAMDLATNVYGAKVIGAAGGPAKCDLVRSYGADAIDYKKDGIRDTVRAMHPRGVDVVFESVGGDTFKECFRSLATDGRLLVIGFAGGKHPTIQANHMLVKNVSVLGVYWGSYKVLNPDLFAWTIQECMRHFNDDKIHPRVDKAFKLHEVNDAFQYIQARKSMGKVVLDMQ